MKRNRVTRFWAVFMALILALMPISPISVWNDTTEVKAAGTTGANPPAPNVPKTGDDAPIGIWTVLMLLGLAGIVGAGFVLTRQKKDE